MNSKRLLIQTGKAVSLNVVAQHIGKVMFKYGYNVIIRRYAPEILDLSKKYDCAIYFYPFSQAFSLEKFYAYYEAKRFLKNRACFYTLADGKLKKYAIPEFVFRDLEFIANSYYSKKKLEEIGVKVIDVVHHGYDPEEIKMSKVKAGLVHRELRNKFKDKCILLYISDYNIRKGLEELLNAVKILSSSRKDFVVLLHIPSTAMTKIKNVENVVVIDEFGSLSHYEIYALVQSVDYLLYPNRVESFGLPVLEANAVNVPVIATKLPVFLEYTDTENNIFVDPETILETDTADGILYELHLVNPKDLADAIDYALDIYFNYRSKYYDMCMKVYEKVKDMTIYNLYRKFLKYIGHEDVS